MASQCSRLRPPATTVGVLAVVVVVKALALRAFRGVSDTLEVDVSRVGETECTCTIFFGENGSGKSSIVDALEFVLRGRLSRRGVGGQKFRRETKNLTMPSRAPGVAIQLASGEALRRGRLAGAFSDFEEVLTMAPVSGFEWAPIVIRRTDIERFWAVPSEVRQEVFYDFMRNISFPAVSERTMEELRMREEVLRQAADEARQELIASAKKAGRRGIVIPTSLRELQLLEHELPPPETWVGRGNVLTTAGWLASVLPPYRRQLEVHDAARRELESVESSNLQLVENARLSRFLTAVANRVSKDFIELAELQWLRAVEISAHGTSGLEVTVLPVGAKGPADPQQVLSEAALDLLALLILFEMHLASVEMGQKRLIVLDDVFQSVDSNYRGKALQHVIERAQGWQVLATTHDQLWMELMARYWRQAGRQVKVIEVARLLDGRTAVTPATTTEVQRIERLLTSGSWSPIEMVSSVGLALERLSQELSVSLACRIVRTRGDRYTLGQLWSGVQAELRRHGPRGIEDCLESVTRGSVFRNLVGAHYNEWAVGVTRNEARSFAEAVLSLHAGVLCSCCGSPWAKFTQSGSKAVIYDYACGCGR